jgi:hypothetical protein
MDRAQAFAAALVLLLPASGIAQTSTTCFETECIINPAGVHRFLRPPSRFSVMPERKPRCSAPPAKPEPAEGIRERLGRERLFGIEGTPQRGVLRGSSPVIPRR